MIFDEASQVLPEDAVPSLMRANQLIVAGDPHQLPPTTFFNSVDVTEEEYEERFTNSNSYESLLDVSMTFLDTWPLNWHYRSRNESLIAFSNKEIYSNSLITFPAPATEPAVEHVLVADTTLAGSERSTRSSTEEARAVVKRVITLAKTHSGKSVGVITMGLAHANKIQGILDHWLETQGRFDPFFDESNEERFFIKNLERVQGDERDIILLSVGYCKTAQGTLPLRFGPLLTQGGERRLNVAVTRARERMIVFSSFDDHEIDLSKTSARGVALLKEYITYTKQGSQNTVIGQPMIRDPLLKKVGAMYDDAVFRKVAEVGVSATKIDLAVLGSNSGEPQSIAIEMDGPGYYTLPTVRDREGIRPAMLQGLGWDYARCWAPQLYREAAPKIVLKQGARPAESEEQGRPKQQARVDWEADVYRKNLEKVNHSALRQVSRPSFRRGLPITEYSDQQIIQVINWLRSDGKLRTKEQLLREVAEELGFKRMGKRIRDAIMRASPLAAK